VKRTVLLLIALYWYAGFTQTIKNDLQGKKISFGNNKISLVLDYDRKVNISSLTVNGQQVIAGEAGIYSQIATSAGTWSTLHLSSDPLIKVINNQILITHLSYGDGKWRISENWTFTLTDDSITFHIDRTVSGSVAAEKVSFPAFIFQDTAVWEGAYQDYGGLAWFYLFNQRLDTYGVHSRSSRFWNSRTGNGLTVSVNAPGSQVAMDYSRTAADKLAYTIGISPKEMLPRFDSGTHRRRYIRDRTDVWAPFQISAGRTSQSITLTPFSFKEQFNRGGMVGLNGDQVSAVLNTIARIGVIDKEHFGGNSWHTPYGPICLHEQYIAQLGLAIDDSNYLNGYRQCLDFYRDHAIKPDGRVWARWAYSDEDAMAGEISDKGFYEAQWGYLMDANPDLVTNVAELYDMTGDLAWVKTHQRSCEKALDWIMQRDSNDNGLVEMMTDGQQQKRGSDWLDIVWASYENAFVNAKLYHALVLWAAIEKQLGSKEKGDYYTHFAEKLKASFNRSVKAGGFWDEAKGCYIHWRDKDGSPHGNNMVTPVNFMAIAYGICEEDGRKRTILDNIETQMQKENLFFWPVCMYSYAEGEVKPSQLPFPEYENGDLFLSWGGVAIKAYAAYKPELAVKYVKNILARYAKDGLAFQRYGRVQQDGRGDDILSGNSLSIIGLYQAIYGINPLHNRFYLDPHITPELSGTRLKYNFRGQKLTIGLETNKFSVSNEQFQIAATRDFGFYASSANLSYYNGSTDNASLKIKTAPGSRLMLDISSWDQDRASWTQTSPIPQPLSYTVNDLRANTNYTISINNRSFKHIKSNAAGTLTFVYATTKKPDTITIAL
jgi:hypothetical protein